MKDVGLWLLAMMMESASNTTTERSARFSLMMENPNMNATIGVPNLPSRHFTFDQGRLLHCSSSKLQALCIGFVSDLNPKINRLRWEFVF